MNLTDSVNQLSKAGNKLLVSHPSEGPSEIFFKGNKTSETHVITHTCPSEKLRPLRCVYRNPRTAPLPPRGLGYTCGVTGKHRCRREARHDPTRGSATDTWAGLTCSLPPSLPTLRKRRISTKHA